jgi:hypothetical protein
MKKLNLTLALCLLAAATVTSCKKGEDDPFLSFRSREARLTGEFEGTLENKVSVDRKENAESGSLTASLSIGDGKYESSGSYSDLNGVTYGENAAANGPYEFSTSIAVSSASNYDGKNAYSGDGTYELTIDKDGTYEMTISYSREKYEYSYSLNGGTTTSNGSALYDETEITETGRWSWDNSKKNKSGITFNSDSDNGYLDGTFAIVQLKEKEVILKKDFKSSTSENQPGYTNDVTIKSVTTITLEKKEKEKKGKK